MLCTQYVHFPLIHKEALLLFTYTKWQKRMERGGTVGASIVCTKLRHRSKGRSSTLVPDVEGNLSQDKRVTERKELNCSDILFMIY